MIELEIAAFAQGRDIRGPYRMRNVDVMRQLAETSPGTPLLREHDVSRGIGGWILDAYVVELRDYIELRQIVRLTSPEANERARARWRRMRFSIGFHGIGACSICGYTLGRSDQSCPIHPSDVYKYRESAGYVYDVATLDETSDVESPAVKSTRVLSMAEAPEDRAVGLACVRRWTNQISPCRRDKALLDAVSTDEAGHWGEPRVVVQMPTDVETPSEPAPDIAPAAAAQIDPFAECERIALETVAALNAEASMRATRKQTRSDALRAAIAAAREKAT